MSGFRVTTRLLSCLGFVLLAGCSTWSSLPPGAPSADPGQMTGFPRVTHTPNSATVASVTEEVGSLPDMDRSYRDTITMLGHTIALPAGDWVVIERDRKAYRAGPPTGGVVLMRREGSTLTGLIEIQGNKVARTGVTNPVNPFCTMTAVIWRDVQAATAGGQQDCAMITFARPATWQNDSAPEALRAVAKGLVRYGVTPPPVLVTVGFYVANPTHSLSVVVWLNPDTSGIAQDRSTERSQSDWAPANLARDPRKQAYIDQVKAWSMQWRAGLKAALEGRPATLSAQAVTTP